MIRFLLLRFLPRRLLPLLTVVEVFLMVQRLRAWRRRPTGRPAARGRSTPAAASDVAPAATDGRRHGA